MKGARCPLSAVAATARLARGMERLCAVVDGGRGGGGVWVELVPRQRKGKMRRLDIVVVLGTLPGGAAVRSYHWRCTGLVQDDGGAATHHGRTWRWWGRRRTARTVRLRLARPDPSVVSRDAFGCSGAVLFPDKIASRCIRVQDRGDGGQARLSKEPILLS